MNEHAMNSRQSRLPMSKQKHKSDSDAKLNSATTNKNCAAYRPSFALCRHGSKPKISA